MKSRAGCLAPSRRQCNPGFSLVELLLTVALILVLLGAVVFNFSSLQQDAALDEGATQLESLIRYVRAHASNTGRKVRITFEEDVGDGLMVPLGNFSVTWEADPLGQPNLYTTLPETSDFVKSILDVISIENVRPLATAIAPPVALDATPSDPAPGNDDTAAAAGDSAFGFPPIHFYPDGSCDSTELVISSRNSEDTRRMNLRLTGLTGSIRRRLIAAEPLPIAAENPASAAAPAGTAVEP